MLAGAPRFAAITRLSPDARRAERQGPRALGHHCAIVLYSGPLALATPPQTPPRWFQLWQEALVVPTFVSYAPTASTHGGNWHRCANSFARAGRQCSPVKPCCAGRRILGRHRRTSGSTRESAPASSPRGATNREKSIFTQLRRSAVGSADFPAQRCCRYARRPVAAEHL